MPTSTTAVVLLRDVCERLHAGKPFPAIGVSTALGSTTTLADATRLAYADADTDALENPIIRIDELVTNGPASGSFTRARDGGLTVATGVVTFSPALLAVQTGTDYSLWWHIHPAVAWDIMLRVLRLLQRQVLLPVSAFADGDMESSATSDYSATTATLSKITTAVNVLHGARSLRVLANAGTPRAESAAYFRVVRDEQWLASMIAQAAVGTAKLVAWDSTNSVEIDSGSHSQQAFAEVELNSFSIPETCERLVLRIEGTGASDDLYVDDVVAWPVMRNRFVLPSWVEDPSAVLEVGYYERGNSISGATDGYLVDETAWKTWPHQLHHEEGAANPFWITFDVPIKRPLFVRVQRPFTEFTADTDTTTADRELLVNLTLYYIYDHLATEAGESGNTAQEVAWRRKGAMLAQTNQVRQFLLRHGDRRLIVDTPQRGPTRLR